jgi:hemerythrin superfamily protein
MSEHIPLKGLQSSLSQVHSYAENINKTGKISDQNGQEVPLKEVLSTLQNTIEKLEKPINEGFLTDRVASDIKSIQKYVNAHLENSSEKDQFEKVQDIYNKVAAGHILKPSS